MSEMDRNDLFLRLAKYRSTSAATPKEDFFTQLVAYILENDEAAKEEFVNALWKQPPQSPFDGRIHVQTQAANESDTPGIGGKRPDLVINYEGGGKLLIECKLNAPLSEEQLESYVRYAEEQEKLGRNTKVVVVSKSKNLACSKTHTSLFLREVLWYEIADRWQKVHRDQPRRVCSDRFVMDGALTFMEDDGMGPLIAFAENEMGAPTHWRTFESKVEKVLSRFSDTIGEPAWALDCGLNFHKQYSSSGKVNYCFNGVLWGGEPRQDHFWYFLGFMYGNQDWYPKLRDDQWPECTALIGAWGASEKIQQILREAKDKLNGNVPPPEPKFELERLNGQHVFLFRRQGLRTFLDLANQAEALLDFLKKSHEYLEPWVCEVATRHLTLRNSG